MDLMNSHGFVVGRCYLKKNGKPCVYLHDSTTDIHFMGGGVFHIRPLVLRHVGAKTISLPPSFKKIKQKSTSPKMQDVPVLISNSLHIEMKTRFRAPSTQELYFNTVCIQHL